jgi:hypothetical protein
MIASSSSEDGVHSLHAALSTRIRNRLCSLWLLHWLRLRLRQNLAKTRSRLRQLLDFSPHTLSDHPRAARQLLGSLLPGRLLLHVGLQASLPRLPELRRVPRRACAGASPVYPLRGLLGVLLLSPSSHLLALPLGLTLLLGGKPRRIRVGALQLQRLIAGRRRRPLGLRW